MNVIAKKYGMLKFLNIYCEKQYKCVIQQDFNEIKPKYTVNAYNQHEIEGVQFYLSKILFTELYPPYSEVTGDGRIKLFMQCYSNIGD